MIPTYCVVTRGQHYIFIYFVPAHDKAEAERMVSDQMGSSETIQSAEPVYPTALIGPTAIPLEDPQR